MHVLDYHFIKDYIHLFYIKSDVIEFFYLTYEYKYSKSYRFASSPGGEWKKSRPEEVSSVFPSSQIIYHAALSSAAT